MKCRYKGKIFLNEENGYTIAVYVTEDPSVPLAARDKYLAAKKTIAFTAIGYGLPLTDQIELEMEGNWENSDHGLQFKVENFMEIVPRTKEGILGYLSCGAIKGVGPKMADAIYMKFGLNTLEVMENTPEELLKIRGISEKKLAGIKESFGKNKVFRELMTFLAPYHVTPKKVTMILQQFRDESIHIVRNRPYMLCAVKGFGFLTVDAIGRQNFNALNDPMRISGCVGYVLQEAGKEGHLFLEQRELLKKALGILNRDMPQQAVTEQEINQVLYRLVMQGSIVLDEGRIYTAKQYEEENQTASIIARKLLERRSDLDIETDLALAEKDLAITLSERQREAVRMVFHSPVSIITGGPGTGKTTVLKVILYIHKRLVRTQVQLMAPTGRAARRMAESTGYQDASTMHMALGIIGEEADPELEVRREVA
ncbi:MAG: helix-hairpin-helix domain-containing protein [Eubacteriales bacterium]|nr:helix-hairpin-helix domain-containing protein [Eubacteriales bacterium]